MFKNFMSYSFVLSIFFVMNNFVFIHSSFAAEGKLETSLYKFYKVPGTYEDVRVDLEYAITGRGIKINGVSHISEMLTRTGKDIGRTKKIYGHAEAIEFCSATLSRDMMEADPTNIIFCPYIIYIYSLKEDKNSVYLGYRKISGLNTKASKKAAAAIIKTYEGIIEDAR